MQAIWEKLGEQTAFLDWREDLEESLQDELDVDLQDDVLTWIGPEVSFAIRDIDPDDAELEAAMTIDVRDHNAAEDFLLGWIEFQEEDYGTDFDRNSKGDFDIWVREDEIYGLSGKLMIATTDERLLSAII